MHPLLFILLVIIGTIILVVSLMLLSGAAGGIELGPIHLAILKAVVLVTAVNLVNLIPVAGIFLTIPVWWFGLYFLFRIDFWDCRIPVLVNWILNLVTLLLAWGIVAVYNAEAEHGISS